MVTDLTTLNHIHLKSPNAVWAAFMKRWFHDAVITVMGVVSVFNFSLHFPLFYYIFAPQFSRPDFHPPLSGASVACPQGGRRGQVQGLARRDEAHNPREVCSTPAPNPPIILQVKDRRFAARGRAHIYDGTFFCPKIAFFFFNFFWSFLVFFGSKIAIFFKNGGGYIIDAASFRDARERN